MVYVYILLTKLLATSTKRRQKTKDLNGRCAWSVSVVVIRELLGTLSERKRKREDAYTTIRFLFCFCLFLFPSVDDTMVIVV